MMVGIARVSRTGRLFNAKASFRLQTPNVDRPFLGFEGERARPAQRRSHSPTPRMAGSMDAHVDVKAKHVGPPPLIDNVGGGYHPFNAFWRVADLGEDGPDDKETHPH